MLYKADVTAWRTWDEWDETYSNLYSENKECVLFGCNRVDSWKARLNIPTSVEVTAVIQRELLQSKNQYALALALIRFVNGVADPIKRQNMDRSISSIGESYNVPSLLVDIRQSATHGLMPSFEFLEHGAQITLTYLRENYWEPQRQLIESTRNSLFDRFLGFLIEDKYPFHGYSNDAIISFGVDALVKIVLNDCQSPENVSEHFVEKVVLLLSEGEKVVSSFSYAFSMALGEKVARGSVLAAFWLEKLVLNGISPKKSLSLLLRWAKPDLLALSQPETLLSKLKHQSPKPGVWPMCAIGSLPGRDCELMLCDDQISFISPLIEAEEEEKEPIQQIIINVPEVIEEIPKQKKEIEIW